MEGDDDVRSGRAVAPAMVCYVIAVGAFFGGVIAASALGPTSAAAPAAFYLGAVIGAVALAVGTAIAVVWVHDLWESGKD